MFLVNETVVYGNSEVCKVKEISNPEFLKTKEDYYYLQPYYNKKSILYVKTEKPQKTLRKTLLKEEILSVLKDLSSLPPIYNENEKIREKEYSEIISSCDFVECLKAIKGIHIERARRAETGLRLNVADDKNLRKFESSVQAEISTAFEISTDEAKDLLLEYNL